MLADVIHRELLNSRRYRFCTEGSDAKGRHIKVSHFASASWVRHYRLEEGRPRLEERDLVPFDNRREATRMGE